MEGDKPVCVVCGTTEQLLRCAKCKTSFYCSTNHQHLDWPSHKRKCRQLAKRKDNNIQLQQLQQAVAAASINSASSPSESTIANNKQKSNKNPYILERKNLTTQNVATTDEDKTLANNEKSDASDGKSDVRASMSLMLGTSESEILSTKAEIVSPSNSNGRVNNLGNNEANSTTFKQMNNCSNGAETLESKCEPETALAKDEEEQKQKPIQHLQVTKTANPNHKGCNNKQNEKSTRYQIKSFDEIALGNSHELRYEELCRIIISDLNQYGLSVLDDFLGMEKGLDILKEVHRMHATGVFKDGQLVSNSVAEQDLRTIRGDKIAWVKGVEDGCSSIGYLINQIDTVICRANTMNNNGKLGSYNIRERTKAMVACYPGSGSHYVMHVDNPNHDGRVITAIYYLNLNWDASSSGGMLRIFPEHGGSIADIEPKFDRLIFFWSDMRNPHEVQPAHRTRYAITVWYFDANEREAALNRFRHDNSSSINAAAPPTIAATSDVCT